MVNVFGLSYRSWIERGRRLALGLLFFCFLWQPTVTRAEAEGSILFLSPNSGTNLVGSTFNVSVLLNTQGESISAVQLDVKFPADKLRIVKPSSDKSLLAIWLEPPVYSNTDGTAKLVGIIPNGITTESGLVTTITFEAIATGLATVEVQRTSSVLANDGQGTELLSGFGRATFELTPKPPEGVEVFSDTHPFGDIWYNNSSPALSLDKPEGIQDFSYELDNKPFTIPDNTPDTADDVVAFEGTADGLWYFHVKARKDDVWGTTTHMPLRIDTTPPAAFTPHAEILFSGQLGKVLVSFFTTDAHSGIDHYEVGVLSADQDPSETPAFVRAESPYQLPNVIGKNFRVVVRAFDRAGNVRDEQITVTVSTTVVGYIRDHIFTILGLGLGILVAYLLLHLHLLRRLRRYRQVMHQIKEEEHEAEEARHHHDYEIGSDTHES
jgi:hypothetical protein